MTMIVASGLILLLVPLLSLTSLRDVCLCQAIKKEILCIGHCVHPMLICRYVRRPSVQTLESAGEEASTRQPLPPSWYIGNISR